MQCNSNNVTQKHVITKIVTDYIITEIFGPTHH